MLEFLSPMDQRKPKETDKFLAENARAVCVFSS